MYATVAKKRNIYRPIGKIVAFTAQTTRRWRRGRWVLDVAVIFSFLWPATVELLLIFCVTIYCSYSFWYCTVDCSSQNIKSTLKACCCNFRDVFCWCCMYIALYCCHLWQDASAVRILALFWHFVSVLSTVFPQCSFTSVKANRQSWSW